MNLNCGQKVNEPIKGIVKVRKNKSTQYTNDLYSIKGLFSTNKELHNDDMRKKTM